MWKKLWHLIHPSKPNYTAIRIELIWKMLNADPVAKVCIYQKLIREEHGEKGCIICSNDFFGGK
jgi:hypothetical protein